MSRMVSADICCLHGEFRALYIVEASRLDLPEVKEKNNEPIRTSPSWAIWCFCAVLLSMSPALDVGCRNPHGKPLSKRHSG